MEITVKLRKTDLKEFLDDWLDETLYNFDSEILLRAGTPAKKDLIEQLLVTGSLETLIKKYLPAEFNDRIYESLDSMFYDRSVTDIDKLIENCERACVEIRKENEAAAAEKLAKQQKDNQVKSIRQAKALLAEAGYTVTKSK